MIKRVFIAGVVAVAVVLAISAATVVGSTLYFASRGLAEDRIERADVILVLSAGLVERGGNVIDLDPFSRARVEAGVALWRAGVAPSILMSGGPSASLDEHVGERMKLVAVELGVPEEAVFVEGLASSTFENARFTMAVAAEEGWTTAVIVTDDFHLARARALFEFWRPGRSFEIVGLAPASGRAAAPFIVASWMLLRETLAYPYNLAKVSAQLILEAVGLGDERIIR